MGIDIIGVQLITLHSLLLHSRQFPLPSSPRLLHILLNFLHKPLIPLLLALPILILILINSNLLLHSLILIKLVIGDTAGYIDHVQE